VAHFGVLTELEVVFIVPFNDLSTARNPIILC
jgi:hypothetical protein